MRICAVESKHLLFVRRAFEWGMVALPKGMAAAERVLSKLPLQDVCLSEHHGGLRLEGEAENYEQIIDAGKAAVRFSYKGVINDIRLKGFSEPPMRAPAVRDASLHNLEVDVLVIGGGVIGCAIARELKRYDVSVMLLEKEADVAMHTSSRNDGMIHPGTAANPSTLKARLNVRGNAMYTELTKELRLPFKRTGNLVVYNNPLLTAPFRAFFLSRCLRLGVEGRFVSKQELSALEPNLRTDAAGGYFFPSAGVLSPYLLTVALAENAVENGVKITLETAAESMVLENGRIAGVVTNRGTIRPRVVVNAAGAFADKVAEMANDRFFSIHPRKGELVILDKKKGGLIKTCLSLVSASQRHATTKGGGMIPTIDGNILVGPDAYEQPYRETYDTNAGHVSAILKKHLPLIRGVCEQDVITYFSGVRAATYEEDYVLERSCYVKNLVHAAGIQSPGLASAPAIAQDVAKLALEALPLTVQKNASFNPKRRAYPDLSRMSFSQKQQIIQNNPDYGVIVCRCEGVSKGEIINAIRSPVPALSLDAIKRRVRPGMGRCQGGFCSPSVTKLIAQYGGVKITDVTKKGVGSALLVEKTHKGEQP